MAINSWCVERTLQKNFSEQQLAGPNPIFSRAWVRFPPLWLLLVLIPGKKAKGADYSLQV
jgi:hypothetical protein